MDWKEYQKDTASFFRSLGFHADTDFTLKGARTTHDIDVLVKSHRIGFNITWIVECKFWMSRVSKIHVLALREIVNDTGADKGILLAENGAQKGAYEAATLTNIQITSLADLSISADKDIQSMRLHDAYDRLMQCKNDYWDIPKSHRIESGLRPDFSEVGYSGNLAINTAEELISKGLRGIYPISLDEAYGCVTELTIAQRLPNQIDTLTDLLATVLPIVQSLEEKIKVCQRQWRGGV